MDTAGEYPVKRETRSENEKYYPGSFAFAWVAQNYGTADCNVAPTSDGNDLSIETERGIVGAGETPVGSPQDSWTDAGRATEPDRSECERYASSWWQ